MTGRILVAGIGNIFLGDDGFGVEVVRRLSTMAIPDGVIVADFGIRGIHLAYEMLDGYDHVVLVDAMSHGGEPGAIALVEAETDASTATDAPDGHDMHPAAVLAYVKAIGGTPPPVTVVGCQPASIDEGIGLSEAVASSIDDAVSAVLALINVGSVRLSRCSARDRQADRHGPAKAGHYERQGG
jgi:hydrogenase maturation protease